MELTNSSDTSSSQDTVINWAEPVARAGYVAKGVVFGTVGVLAIMSALGLAGGDVTGAKGAIEYLAGLGGGLVLGLIALGMAAFAAWRFVQAFLDPEDKGSDAKGLMRRLGLAGSGVTYSGLAIFAATQLFSSLGSAGASSGGTEERAAEVMSVPGGVWVVGLFGLIMLGVGFYQAYRSYAASFKDHWHTEQMGRDELLWATRISRTGIAARAIAFVLIGWSLLQAAMAADADQANGLEGALKSFGEGPFLMGAIGLGFVCYGVYCVVNARYKSLTGG